MNVDWGQALQVGGFGFLLVFVVLTILAIAMWLIGWFFDKSAGIKNPFKREKEIYPEEDKPKEEPEYNPEYKIDNTDCYE
ncbi:MAG: OadG family protein [Dehalococcoidales bacterium]|jgi:Na+-transporting methylmalonyl-CoA/oxaloacetate decarboxylase gamma subunit|nr:OadG family protein [Dehalococcoidales bacterium]